MAYFQIEKTGCMESQGLVQVRADFYRSETDPEYVLTPRKLTPPDGYPGAMDADGQPVDSADYQTWEDNLPVEMKNFPFYSHVIYFDPHHTDEGILFCFELVLAWLKQGVKPKNVVPVFKPFWAEAAQMRVAQILATDFASVSGAEGYSVR